MSAVNDRENLNMESVPKSVNYIQVAQHLLACVRENGKLSVAKSILRDMSKEVQKEIVNTTVDGDTPLSLAAQLGHVHLVNYLLDECGADIEKRGLVEVSRKCYQAPPLWCASAANQLEVVKTLIQHGADVDGTSDTGSTPVHSACYMTNIEVVKYLVEHGADIHKPNMKLITCLMVSVESVELCTFLLQRNATVNAQDKCGNSALHRAISKGKFDTVQLLLKYKSNPYLKNIESWTDALQTATLNGEEDILKYLITEINPSQKRQVEAYDLLGAHFVETDDTQNALRVWSFAMNLRHCDKGNIVERTNDSEPIKAYNRAKEAESHEELQEIAHNPDKVYMQALLIRERILGRYHTETLNGLMNRGVIYANSRRYQRAIDLLRYAFQLRCEKQDTLNYRSTENLLYLCEVFFVFNEKYTQGFIPEPVQFDDVICVMDIAYNAVMHQLTNSSPDEECDTVLVLVIHLIKLLCKMTKNEQQTERLKKTVQHFVELKPQTQQGSTLLHLAVKQNTVIESPHMGIEFPSLDVVKVLIECGSDVNCLDSNNNTPLGFCLHNSESDEASEHAQETEAIAQYLNAHNAHSDAKTKTEHQAVGSIKSAARTTPPYSSVWLSSPHNRVELRKKIQFKSLPSGRPSVKQCPTSEEKCRGEASNSKTESCDAWLDNENVSRDATSEGKQLYSELQPHISVLLNAMPYKVQDNLVAAKLLSVIDIGHIKAESTTHGMNSKMYQMVISRVKTASDRIDVRRAVCKGLCESAQYCPFSRKERPASAIQGNTLNKIRLHLVSDAELNPVIDRLIEAQIIDEHIQQRIGAEKTTRDQVDVLLQFISHTHSRGHDTFMKILKDTHCWMFEDSTGK